MVSSKERSILLTKVNFKHFLFSMFLDVYWLCSSCQKVFFSNHKTVVRIKITSSIHSRVSNLVYWLFVYNSTVFNYICADIFFIKDVIFLVIFKSTVKKNGSWIYYQFWDLLFAILQNYLLYFIKFVISTRCWNTMNIKNVF